MPYAGGVSYNKKKCCLPNTRISILLEICDWVDCFDEEENEKVFLLTGVAGSGKSSIAHSICDHYSQRKRLGSSFFFNNRSTDPPGGEKVFSTIARDIADKFPLFKVSLVNIVDKERSIRLTKQPGEQFQSFIVEPSKALADSEAFSVGPVLIVIDALDECPAESKDDFIQTLVDDLSHLPPNFRLIITSRPEDVQGLLESGFVHHVDLDRIGPTEVEADIRLFVRDRLAKVAQRLDNPRQRPHHGDWLERLVQRSEKLFIWAETACKQITSSKSRTPPQVLDDILKHGGSGIDDLYLLALQRALGEDPQTLCDFRSLMSRIIILKIPFSVNELNFLQSFVDADDDFPFDVSILVSHLGAVLGGAANFDEPIQFLHSSFRDFLLDNKRSGVFCINDTGEFADAHFALASTCAAVFKNLDFNLSPKSNIRTFAYSVFFAKHFIQSGRPFDEGLLENLDFNAIDNWFNNKINYDGISRADELVLTEGMLSLNKICKQFIPEFTCGC